MGSDRAPAVPRQTLHIVILFHACPNLNTPLYPLSLTQSLLLPNSLPLCTSSVPHSRSTAERQLGKTIPNMD